MPNDSPERRRRRITAQRTGPLLIEGPVEVTLDDGTVVSSDRFCVALCTCRRSRTYPWCDTSHRKPARPNQTDTPGPEATTELSP
ncbi:CDGSH iron-sulfur domain-containing protein [Streptomyces sp. NPDC048275]|uniref:CDGSH iron-sulfur domain-containing protein n=1 Tax=Streptomyces sp. NPDC048275 TaxID=3155629 RepID=UPI003411082C